MPKEDGQPAFPTHPGMQFNDGMTLRDYFAAKAMLMFPECHSFSNRAKLSYELADAMLNEREK